MTRRWILTMALIVIYLSIRLPGPDGYAQDADNVLFQIWKKEDSIVAEASAEHTLPLLALKGLHVPLEGVGLHLVKRASDTLPNGLWQCRGDPVLRHP